MAIKVLCVAMATLFLIQGAIYCQDDATTKTEENSEDANKQEADVSKEIDQIIQHLKDRVDEFGRQIQDNALYKNLTHYVGKINAAINEQGQRIMKKL